MIPATLMCIRGQLPNNVVVLQQARNRQDSLPYVVKADEAQVFAAHGTFFLKRPVGYWSFRRFWRRGTGVQAAYRFQQFLCLACC